MEYVPPDFDEEVSISKVTTNYNQNGSVSSYEVMISLDLLNECKVLKKRSLPELEALLQKTLESWARQFEKHQKEQYVQKLLKNVEQLNSRVTKERKALQNLLNHTLDIDDAVNFEDLKLNARFKIHPSQLFNNKVVPEYLSFDSTGKPIKIIYIMIPIRPTLHAIKRNSSFIKNFFFPKKIEEELKHKTQEWEHEVEQIKSENAEIKKIFESAFFKYMEMKANFEEVQNQFNKSIKLLKQRYLERHGDAVEEYCNIVLQQSEYPNWFQKKWNLQYYVDNKILAVEYSLPSPNECPSIESYSYDKKTNKIIEKDLSEKEFSCLYDDIVISSSSQNNT